MLELLTGDVAALEISTIGTDGLLPKLDLYLLIDFYFRRFGRSALSLPGPRSPRDLLPPSWEPTVVPWLQAVSRHFPGSEAYLDKLTALLRFVAQQASGVPDGTHAVCKQWGLDAVTARTRRGLVRLHLAPNGTAAAVMCLWYQVVIRAVLLVALG